MALAAATSSRSSESPPSLPSRDLRTLLRQQVTVHGEAIERGIKAREVHQREISELASLIEVRTRSLGFIGTILGFSGIGERFYTAYDQLAKDRATLRSLSAKKPIEEQALRKAQRVLIVAAANYLKANSRIFGSTLERLEQIREVEQICHNFTRRSRTISYELAATDTVHSVGNIRTRIPSPSLAAPIIRSAHRKIGDATVRCEQLKATYPDLAPAIRSALRAFGLIREHLFGSKQNEWGLREGLTPCHGKAAGAIVEGALTVLAQRCTRCIAKIREQELLEVHQQLAAVLREEGLLVPAPFSPEEVADTLGFSVAGATDDVRPPLGG